jgi:hypothetical protein
MPEVVIRKGVWNGLVDAAEKQGRRPETLANEALEDFLRRLSDEELLARSTAASRRHPVKMQDTEGLIRRYRRRT